MDRSGVIVTTLFLSAYPLQLFKSDILRGWYDDGGGMNTPVWQQVGYFITPL